MNWNKLNVYLSTFNFVLIIVGFQLVTTMFLPAEIDASVDKSTVSTTVTLPYRAFVLAIALSVIVVNWNQHFRLNVGIRLHLVFWGLLLIRIAYDLLLRTDIVVESSIVQEIFMRIFLICVIPAFSVFRSVRVIDFQLAVKWLFAAFLFLVPLFYIKNPLLFSTIDPGMRLEGNIAMNSISLGHYGVTLALLALYIKSDNESIWKTVFCYIVMLIGAFVTLRSGSRGPLVALVCCLLFFFMARQRYSILTVGFMALLIIFFGLSSDILLERFQQITPELYSRMSLSGNVTQYEEFMTGRSGLYSTAINDFLDYPVFGKCFAIFRPDGSFSYSHNIILDAFMGLGLFGGMLFVSILFLAVKSSFLTVYHLSKHWWLGIMCFHFVISDMYSGCFYYDDILNVFLFILLYKDVNK